MFNLISKYKPSGDQPEAIEKLVNGIKNGKAEFVIEWNAKKSAEASWKTYSEKIEVSSLEEFLDSRFNLEPWNKWTNSWRYNKLNELIGEKIEPLDRLQNKIRNKKRKNWWYISIWRWSRHYNTRRNRKVFISKSWNFNKI